MCGVVNHHLSNGLGIPIVPMKTALRWAAVMPAAIIACLAVQLLNILFGIFLPAFVVQLWNCWIGTAAFIFAGCYAAPRFKFSVAIGLAIIQAMVLGIYLFLGPENQSWFYFLLMAAVTFAELIYSCTVVRDWESEVNIDAKSHLP